MKQFYFSKKKKFNFSLANIFFKQSILFFGFIFISASVYTQEISGVVKNAEGIPIPYATIYIEELQTGTSTNQHGFYDFKISSGTYSINYRALGYSPLVKKVTVTNSNTVVDVELPLQSYILAGVTVRADNEDPAYSIMRKAIARAPGFINQAKSYTSEVYIKGAMKATKIPRIVAKRLEVQGERPVEGQIYVNESFNKITFKAPDSYTQEVISANNSFPISDKDVPIVGLISNSIYESQDDFYISPFAPNAFSHYKFKSEGLMQNGNLFIEKIRVTPKRKSKLLMSGYLYIIEDLWCLYSYDVNINPPYTKLHIKQHFAPVKGDNYFPVSLFAEAKVGFMGVKADATYTTTMKYTNVVINPLFAQKKAPPVYTAKEEKEDVAKPKKENTKVEKINKQLDELYKKDDLSNREMAEMQKLISKKSALLKTENQEDPLEVFTNYKQIIHKDARAHDSSYWDSVRPIPASKEEKISYKKKSETILKEKEKPFYKKFFQTLAFGNYEWERSKKFHAFYPGIIDSRNIRFHPVDGLMLNQSFKIRYELDSVHVLRTKGMLGYAFGRKSFFGEGQLSYWYLPKRMGFAEINYGYLSEDFNGSQSRLDGINSLYNIFLKENYIKKYLTRYISAKNYFELFNGFETSYHLKYKDLDTLNNVSNFSVFYPKKNYEPNIPQNIEINSKHLLPQQELVASLGFSYAHKCRYSFDNNGRKRIERSKYPRINFYYSYAIPANNNFSNYSFASLSSSHYFDIYSTSSFKYYVNAGMFLGVKKIHFSSFKHFTVIEEPFALRDFDNSFMLINSYEYSTSKKFLRAHFKYINQFLFLKRLPIISETLWDENLFASFLLVENRKPYLELGYSVSKIMFNGEIGVFTGFSGINFKGIGIKGRFRFQ